MLSFVYCSNFMIILCVMAGRNAPLCWPLLVMCVRSGETKKNEMNNRDKIMVSTTSAMWVEFDENEIYYMRNGIALNADVDAFW